MITSFADLRFAQESSGFFGPAIAAWVGMKRRRSTDQGATTIAVTTSDGHRFRAAVSAIGREAEPRWVLLDADGKQFMGPVVTSDRTPEGVQRQVDEWWQSQRGAV